MVATCATAAGAAFLELMLTALNPLTVAARRMPAFRLGRGAAPHG
jgi:hypothetical protein